MMKKEKSNKDLFKAIAREEGISSDEAKKEIEQTILAARDNPDPKKRAEFKKLFGDRIPTPEEFIYVVTREIKEQPVMENNQGKKRKDKKFYV